MIRNDKMNKNLGKMPLDKNNFWIENNADMDTILKL